jgi:hypothetical protein
MKTRNIKLDKLMKTEAELAVAYELSYAEDEYSDKTKEFKKLVDEASENLQKYYEEMKCTDTHTKR